jgi:hypothetical protein
MEFLPCSPFAARSGVGCAPMKIAWIFFLIFLPTIAFAEPMLLADQVEVCTIPLPVFDGYPELNRYLLGTKHIYIRVNGKTYGTPFTAKHTYFGGDAYLYSEDLYARNEELLRHEKCFKVLRPEALDESAFARKLECISGKMTMPFKSTNPDLSRQWYPVFDYHGINNNCGSMADYLVSCGGGKIRKLINYSVGNKVPLSKKAKIVSMVEEGKVESSTYGEICQKALLECEEPSPVN